MKQNMNTVKERPILFSGPMVRAILAGEKTQTRRVVKPQPPYEGIRLNGPESYHPAVAKNGFLTPGEPVFGIYDDEGEYGCVCTYGSPGDRLWVRETVYCDDGNGINDFDATSVPWEHVYYRADGECCEQIPECQCSFIGKPKWTPSIHMPRWASRITLEVTGVRVERLQDISEADAKAEGVEIAIPGTTWYRDYNPGKQDAIHPDPHYGLCPDAYASYESLWGSINGPESWAANPWVWVVEFRRI